MPPDPAVLIMSAGARVRSPIADSLGRERSEALQELLLARAVSWASGIGGAAMSVSAEEDLTLAAESALTDVAADAPLLIAWPDLPRWRADLAAAALDDLADGCDLALGPVFDGGFYLLALTRPLVTILGHESLAWRRADALGATLAIASERRIEAGLLRAERALHTVEDVAAARADPMLDEELRALLS